MPLGPNTKKFFEQLIENAKDQPIKPLGQSSIEEFRKECDEGFTKFASPLPEGITLNDFVEQTLQLDEKRSITIQTFIPKNLSAEKTLPTMIFFPPGGFCLSLNTYQAGCATMAIESGCKAIVIKHPLAPEYSPQEITDICYDTTKFLYQHHQKFNIDQNNFFVAGVSTGSTLAAVMTNRSLQDASLNIQQQILVTPLVDFSLELHHNNSYMEYQQHDIMLTNEALEYFASLYIPPNIDRKLPFISPLFCKDFSNMPPTLIIVGEYDALRAEGTRYSEVLKQAGNRDVELITCEGQTHNLMACRSVLNDGEDPAVLAAEFIKKHLKT